jgi:hypothetical protein
VTCPVCGGANPHEAQFCTSCGRYSGSHKLAPLGSQGKPDTPEDIAGKLVPRDIPGLLLETFRVYRRGFQSFLLIALIPQAPLIPLSFVPDSGPLAIMILAIGVSLVLSALASGAMVCAVSQQYLGRPIEVRDCYGRAWARVMSLVLSTAAFLLAIVGAVAPSLALSTATAPALVTAGAFATIIGMPLAIYLAVNWFFFSECIMLERKGPLASLWHSRELVKGRFWRVLGIGAVFAVIGIAGTLAAFTASLIFEDASPVLGALVYAAVITALLPIMWIGETLVYYDLRVRKDGYSVENLAREMGED